MINEKHREKTTSAMKTTVKIGLLEKFNKILEDKKNLHPSSVTYEIKRRKWTEP